jgi:hypothetical protein
MTVHLLRLRRLSAALLFALAAASPAWAARSDEEPPSLSALAFMSGSWILEDGGTVVEEHWTAADGGLMLGMNRTRRGGRVVMFEFLRIALRGDSLFYVSMPRARGDTVFPLKERSARRVVFENPSHDFPQRIVYWQEREDELRARIEGTMDGRPAGEEWVWRRAQPAR